MQLELPGENYFGNEYLDNDFYREPHFCI
jgi:hypothetical protein